MSEIKIDPDTPKNRTTIFTAICGDEEEAKEIDPKKMTFDYTEETSVPSVIGYIEGKFACVKPFKEFKTEIKIQGPKIKLMY